MGPLAKYLRLDPRERRLVAAAAAALVTTWIGLRLRGFDAVRGAASRARNQPLPRRAYEWCGPPPKWSVSPPTVDRISWAVRVASGYLPGARNCLVRALATQSLLTEYHYPSQLRIGVRKSPAGGLDAHAWLECAGTVVIGEFELDRYAILKSNRWDQLDHDTPGNDSAQPADRPNSPGPPSSGVIGRGDVVR